LHRPPASSREPAQMKIKHPGAPARLTVLVALAALSASLAGCGGRRQRGAIVAFGAENQYANAIEQVGGRYVKTTAIESNPNTDPHSFEASPSVAQVVGAARLLVQNGLGYDTYMERIESASGGVGSNAS